MLTGRFFACVHSLFSVSLHFGLETDSLALDSGVTYVRPLRTDISQQPRSGRLPLRSLSR